MKFFEIDFEYPKYSYGKYRKSKDHDSHDFMIKNGFISLWKNPIQYHKISNITIPDFFIESLHYDDILSGDIMENSFFINEKVFSIIRKYNNPNFTIYPVNFFYGTEDMSREDFIPISEKMYMVHVIFDNSVKAKIDIKKTTFSTGIYPGRVFIQESIEIKSIEELSSKRQTFERYDEVVNTEFLYLEKLDVTYSILLFENLLIRRKNAFYFSEDLVNELVTNNISGLYVNNVECIEVQL
jgi:hypothetical protein